MATAFYPQNMKSYNNSITNNYTSWKGTGIYSNPIAITSSNIRPLTNNDPTNDTAYKHGSSRPLKWQFRKGISVPTIIVNPDNPSEYIQINNRQVKSSTSSSLIGQLIDRPGAFSVKENRIDLNNDCNNCNGAKIVTDYYPEPFLTNNPLPVTTSPQNCCNEQKKALKRVRPASTLLKKNYFTTLEQYRQNRCQTYDQRVFNFASPANCSVKPGTPAAIGNTYIANCFPNAGGMNSESDLIMLSFNLLLQNNIFSSTDIDNYYQAQISTFSAFYQFLSQLSNSEQAIAIYLNVMNNPYLGMPINGPSHPKNCKLVIYKPSNPQFATQGSVTSSARTLKLTIAEIEKNIYYNNLLQKSASNSAANPSGQTDVPFIYKAKSAPCNPALPIIFRQVSYNPTTCFQQIKVLQNLGNLSAGPTPANNGISASFP